MSGREPVPNVNLPRGFTVFELIRGRTVLTVVVSSPAREASPALPAGLFNKFVRFCFE
jgi:hypothetical protein